MALERFKVLDRIVEEWNKNYREYSPPQRMEYLLRMAALGLQASPRTVDMEPVRVFLEIHGLEDKAHEIQGRVIDPPALPLPGAASDAAPAEEDDGEDSGEVSKHGRRRYPGEWMRRG
ncbi:MAG: hypothetical protein A2Z06_01335 [Candidatus Glassbacteria bacterium RBG_16_58_8]|uniref:Uncharacterized protein n=1 Tax=Candidatus Glassbacteria bacterium RBG_16_58_8 TaxID=1817866 RepID=A0A1F5YBX8_9BACT|nr:MAG: hypothetical protein A2Z06_01335 [Candidatus Glassbacteria bacterium RBG_16_58_8]